MATYYIDGHNGDDTNNGTSTDTEWLTVGKAFATASAGDTVYIRGSHDGFSGIYDIKDGGDGGQHLEPTNSGSSGSWITFEAYATDHAAGNDPIITNLEVDDGTNWSQFSGNVYRKDFSGDLPSGTNNRIFLVWLNGSNWEMLEYNVGDTANDPDLGAGYFDLTYYYVNVGGDPSSETIYYSDSNITENYNTLFTFDANPAREYIRFKYLIFIGGADRLMRYRGGVNNIDFDGCEFIGGGYGGGISFYTNGGELVHVHDITIQNSSIHDIGRDWAAEDSPVASGISFSLAQANQTIYNVTIDNCEIYNCAKDGIHLGSSGSSTNYMYDVEIKNCIVHNTGEDGIDLKSGHGSNWNCSIHDNLIYDTDENGIGSASESSAPTRWSIYNNYIYNTGNTHSATYQPTEPASRAGIKLVEGSVAAYYRVYNNIITGWGNSGIRIQTGAEADIYNNTFYDNGNAPDATHHSEIYFAGADANINNNIFYQLDDYYCLYLSSNPSDCDNNQIYSTGGQSANPVYYGGAAHTVTELNDQAWATSNQSGDPIFSDKTNNDFALVNGSPAIDTGQTLAATYDDAFDSSESPPSTQPFSTLDQDDFGSGWDIGAYIYKRRGSLILA